MYISVPNFIFLDINFIFQSKIKEKMTKNSLRGVGEASLGRGKSISKGGGEDNSIKHIIWVPRRKRMERPSNLILLVWLTD